MNATLSLEHLSDKEIIDLCMLPNNQILLPLVSNSQEELSTQYLSRKVTLLWPTWDDSILSMKT